MNINTNRVESFSDGVISIIITIMVFNIKFPRVKTPYTSAELHAGLMVVAPNLITYLFSFLVIGILWLNHHHIYLMLQKVDEKLMWLNLHFLFWISLIPFPTSMLGGNPFLPESAAIYGGILFMSAFSFTIMRTYAMRHALMHNDNKVMEKKIKLVNNKAKLKNYIGMAAYFLSMPMAYISVYISFVCFIIPPILFFIPDGIDDEVVAEQIAEINTNASNTPL
ncbi:MAG: DUF1211 domain-containing protein [Taibaiella sp.]|nr:DUF1211 domain-containing protein [Taibaiella sp.]